MIIIIECKPQAPDEHSAKNKIKDATPIIDRSVDNSNHQPGYNTDNKSSQHLKPIVPATSPEPTHPHSRHHSGTQNQSETHDSPPLHTSAMWLLIHAPSLIQIVRVLPPFSTTSCHHIAPYPTPTAISIPAKNDSGGIIAKSGVCANLKLSV